VGSSSKVEEVPTSLLRGAIDEELEKLEKLAEETCLDLKAQ
jgi:hypothetical protein